MNIRINQEYAKLVPPLTKLELESLKESIKLNGLWQPIVVNWQGDILDGHHRFKICQELGIKPKIEFKNFLNSEKEKSFVINSNLKRRQLNDFQKAELAYLLEDVYSTAARQRQLSSLKLGTQLGVQVPNSISSSVATISAPVPSVSNDNNESEKEKGRSSVILADKVGISATIYNRAKKIILEGSEPTKEKLRAGKSTISKEYQRIQKAAAIQTAIVAASAVNSSPNSYTSKLMLGDMREQGRTIPDDSIDLIFTDPPYAQEYLDLYKELVQLACCKLKQGGSLAMYASNQQLDKLFSLMKQLQSNLNYVCIIAVHHNGHVAKNWKYGTWAQWKPLLWYFKGSNPTKFHDLSEFIESQPVSKNNHEWEQSAVEAEHMIKPLTLEGMTVLDPFMGSGTTGIASLKLNRKFIGIEIDPIHYATAKRRLSTVTAVEKTQN